MDISRYFYDHYIMLTELVGLTALLGTGVHLPEKTKRATRIAILLIILESIIWSLEQWTQYHDGHVILRSHLTSGVYILHPLIVTPIIEMTAPVKKHKIWLFVPLFIYVPIVFTSQWTHIIFYINESNHWSGNDHFSRVPYIFFFGYTLVFVVLFIARYINHGLHTMLGVLYIIVASFIGVFLNLRRDSESDYATLFASVIVLYYLFMYQYTAKTDYMTGLMNRQAFYHDLKRYRKAITAVCSVDMNELKWINDSQGHEAGDKAIKSVADCIITGSGSSKYVYRVGGDEFIIFYMDKTEEDVKKDIEKMRENLSETKIVCAFGYSMITEDNDIDTALKTADKEMYSDKAEIKKAVLAAGGKLHRRAGD